MKNWQTELQLPSGTNLTAAFNFKSEMLLSQVTERDDNYRCKDLCNSREDPELLYKQFDKYVVEDDTNQDQHKVPEQLYSALKSRSRKNNEAIKQVACRKADHKRHQKSHDMRAHSSNGGMNDLFFEDIIIGDKINKNIQYGVPSSTGCITECLLRHEPAEEGIEKIKCTIDQVLHLRLRKIGLFTYFCRH